MLRKYPFPCSNLNLTEIWNIQNKFPSNKSLSSPSSLYDSTFSKSILNSCLFQYTNLAAIIDDFLFDPKGSQDYGQILRKSPKCSFKRFCLFLEKNVFRSSSSIDVQRAFFNLHRSGGICLDKQNRQNRLRFCFRRRSARFGRRRTKRPKNLFRRIVLDRHHSDFCLDRLVNVMFNCAIATGCPWIEYRFLD